MTLKFAKKFPNDKPFIGGKETNFPVQILNSLFTIPINYFVAEKSTALEDFDFYESKLSMSSEEITKKCKSHTIRKSDSKYRVGQQIHFIQVHESSPYRFAPSVYIKSVQAIKILWHNIDAIKNDKRSYVSLLVDGRLLSYDESVELAQNDGFRDLNEFACYFDENFEGQLIHWTDLKY